MRKEALKSNKRKTKVLFIAAVVIIIAVLAVGSYSMWYVKEVSGAETGEELVLEEGQYLLYAKITTIAGNEIIYTKLDNPVEKDTETISRDREGKISNGDTDAVSQNGFEPMPGRENAVEKQDRQRTRESIDEKTQESSQLQIPVGTEVITKLGAATTFSRLSNGDTIKMLMQDLGGREETVLKIWIVE